LGEQLAGILVGSFIIFTVGFIDDRKPVQAGIKFLLQIIAAYVAMIYGVRIYGLSIPRFEAYANFPLWLVQLTTVIWLVGMSNAVNLIDGLDGLAAGVVCIVAAAFLAVVLIQEGNHSQLFQHQMTLAGVIAASLLGGTLGFLVYNFYPAQVFMGDSGSLTLGFLLGAMAVIGTFKTTILAVLFTPLFLVAVPMADMTFAFGRRLMSKKNPFAPDRSHLHHRLMDAGWTQREVVLLIYVITLLLAFAVVTAIGIKKA
jgi:UDP-GlcNAc:undecaprenyl-phosphate GlcNAc-1-phosphate transferase